MSRPEIILCDRCGEEIPTWRGKQDSAKLHLWRPGQPRGCGEQRIDFCLECYERFVSFLECQGE